MKRAAIFAASVTALVLIAWPEAHAENLGSDPFGDLTGGHGLIGRYPLAAYSLDTHIDSSLNPASWGEEAVGFVTTILWTITRLLNALVFWLVDTAFNLDLLSSDGPLKPIADAIQSINENVLGEPWMIAMIAFAGLWAIKKGIVERKHSEAASSLALSVVLVIAVMFVVFRPLQTVGQVASWTNDTSEAILVGTNAGSLANPDQAKQRIMDSMVRAVQVEPWAQLNFGGLKHCVDGSRRDKDGYPTPVKCDDPRRTAVRDHMKVVNGMGGYAPRFLELPPGSRARNLEFEALKDGEVPVNPLGGNQFAGYHVDKSDSPAVDIQQSGAADGRLGMAALILLVSVAFATLFGGLAILIMLVQVGALLVVAFSPVAMLAAIMPGPGHALVVAWGKKLLILLVIKAFFALAMSMLIVIHLSLAPGRSGMGWLPMYALIGAFYFLVIWKHKWVGEKMQVSSRRDTTKVESTVREKTVQAGALIAAPVAGSLAMLRDRQESAVSGGQTPAQTTSSVEPQAVESAPSESHGGVGKPGAVVPRDAVEPTSAQSRPPTPEPRTVEPALGSGSAQAVGTATDEREHRDLHPAPPRPSETSEPGTLQPVTNGKPHQPPEPEYPGLGTPESVVSPQRRVPKAEDLAPPPEYRGP